MVDVMQHVYNTPGLEFLSLVIYVFHCWEIPSLNCTNSLEYKPNYAKCNISHWRLWSLTTCSLLNINMNYMSGCFCLFCAIITRSLKTALLSSLESSLSYTKRRTMVQDIWVSQNCCKTNNPIIAQIAARSITPVNIFNNSHKLPFICNAIVRHGSFGTI